MQLSYFSSKTTKDILILILLKHSRALALKDEKKILQISLKIKSPEWNTQTECQTDRMTDRPTLNFINVDFKKIWNIYVQKGINVVNIERGGINLNFDASS